MEYLENLRRRHAGLESDIVALMELYDKKLWHQLSVKLDAMLSNEAISKQLSSLELYEEFIVTFESKINEVSLACLLSHISKHLGSPDAAIDLFQRVVNGKTHFQQDALTCISMDTALMLLKIGKIAEAKERIDAAKDVVSDEAIVHSKVYQAQLDYYRITNQPGEFYRATIMFLTYTTMDMLDLEYKIKLAQDTAVAALTGEGIYNFGEVLATPILSFLAGGPNAWLQPLVHAVNRGEVAECKAILARHGQHLQQSIILEKAALLAVVNIAFHRSALHRQIPFSELTQRTEVSEEHIERLIMRAMSLGLIKGSLDQVSEVLQVTWVQPRVLDKSQLQEMAQHLGAWAERVKTALVTVEDHAIELYS